MIPENKSPAIAAKRFPLTEEEAVSKVAELTSESMDGLVGAIFSNLDQLKKAMADCGWRLDAPVYGESENAVTWIGRADKRERSCKMVINSYGSFIEICNCWMLNGEKEAPPDKQGMEFFPE